MTTLSSIGSMMLFMLLRIEEVARFAALGAPTKDILLFLAIMLPQLAILAIPLAGLIGIYITWNRFSQSCELLGALTCGIRMEHLVFPTVYLSLIMGAISGYLSLDWAPYAQLEAKKLKTYWSQVNPSHLLRSERVWQLPGATLVSLHKPTDLEVFVVSHHAKQNSSQMIHVDNLIIDGKNVLSTDTSTHLIFYPPEHSQYLSLENISQGNYSYFWTNDNQEIFQVSVDQLPLRALLSQLQQLHEFDKSYRKRLQTEIPRRLFFWILPISFSFLAVVSGFHPDRRAPSPSARPIMFWVLLLLLGYFLTKGLNLSFGLAMFFYFGLPLGSIAWSYRQLRKVVTCD